ncbi:hypothetical protein DWU98_12670 [Dyella monticola]|uniref:Uncharacterized protein n=1 Tax=Dyella monticola TaxID=1927958 RepID=A0A370WXE1_9GAMM|nr:hypothetical protein [Dyella monticola]RDS80804.1 hypothetical protein DWU98_12670 [Dyella monticola]
MRLEPICAVAEPIGHSWPSIHWWLSLTAADQGAWVSGIGAFAAAFAAVWVSGRERRLRNRERNELARTAARYLYADLLRLLKEAHMAKINLDTLAEFDDSKPYVMNVGLISGCLGNCVAIAEGMSIERISILPSKVSGPLAMVLGAFPTIANGAKASVQFLGDPYNMPLDIQRQQLRDHSEAITPCIIELRPFFAWFGSQFPDEAKSGTGAALTIIDKLQD